MSSFLAYFTSPEAIKYVAKVEDIFKPLPHLPKGFVDFCVNIAPWVSLLMAILSGIAGVMLLIAGTTSLLTFNPVIVITTILEAVVLIAEAILLYNAYKLLKDRQLTGWIYLFWANAIALVYGLLNVFLGNPEMLLRELILATVGFYVLIETKPAYKM